MVRKEVLGDVLGKVSICVCIICGIVEPIEAGFCGRNATTFGSVKRHTPRDRDRIMKEFGPRLVGKLLVAMVFLEMLSSTKTKL